MQMRNVHSVNILLGGIPRHSHVAYYLPRFDERALLNILVIRVVLAQVRVVIRALFIERAYTQPPAAVLVPADALNLSALNRNNRCSDIAEQVVSEVASAVAIGARGAEVVIMAVGKALGNRAVGNKPVAGADGLSSVSVRHLPLVLS